MSPTKQSKGMVMLSEHNYVAWAPVAWALMKSQELQHVTNKNLLEEDGEFDPDEVAAYNKKEIDKAKVETFEKVNNLRLDAEKEPLEEVEVPSAPQEEEKKEAWLQKVTAAKKNNTFLRKKVERQYKKDCNDAVAFLLKSISPDNLALVKNLDHPSRMWKTLEASHLQMTAGNIIVLQQQMEATKSGECESMKDYLKKMRNFRSALVSAGSTDTEHSFCLRMIDNVHEDFEVYCIILRSEESIRLKKIESVLTTAAATKAMVNKRVLRKKAASNQGGDFTKAMFTQMVNERVATALAAKGHLGEDRKSKGLGACYYWRDYGVCRFGDKCRFSHEGPQGKVRAKRGDLSDSD
jgi:hypothetical protein